jgi:hypothetical protein
MLFTIVAEMSGVAWRATGAGAGVGRMTGRAGISASTGRVGMHLGADEAAATAAEEITIPPTPGPRSAEKVEL